MISRADIPRTCKLQYINTNPQMDRVGWLVRFLNPGALMLSRPTPSAFICPLSCTLLQDPVVDAFDGVTYERNAIEALYHKGERDTPKDIAMFLVPNRTLKELINAFELAGFNVDASKVVNCPIGSIPMSSPHINLGDGFSYEAENISYWLFTLHKRRSPMSNALQWTRYTIPNTALVEALIELQSPPPANPSDFQQLNLDSKSLDDESVSGPRTSPSLQPLIEDATEFLKSISNRSFTTDGVRPFVHVVINAASYFPCNIFIQRLAMEALACLMDYFTEEQETQTLEEGKACLGFISSILSGFPSDGEIIRYGIRATHFTCLNSASMRAILSIHDVGNIVRGMANGISARWVQIEGSKVIQSLCWDVELRRSLIEQGGAEALIKALGNFKDDASVSFHACRALYHLTRKDDDGLCSKKVLAVGGLDLVLDRLEETHMDSDMQWVSLGILCNLLQHQKMTETSRVLSLIASSMTSYRHEAEIQYRGCKAIHLALNMGCEHPSTLLQQLTLCVVSACESFPADTDVQFHSSRALQILGKLGTGEEGRRVVEKGGASALYMGALNPKWRDWESQMEGCFALTELIRACQKQEGRALLKTIRKSQALERLIEIIKVSDKEVGLGMAAVETLAELINGAEAEAWAEPAVSVTGLRNLLANLKGTDTKTMAVPSEEQLRELLSVMASCSIDKVHSSSNDIVPR